MLLAFVVLTLKAKFPAANNITTESLHAQLDRDPDSVILLDVRRKEEVPAQRKTQKNCCFI
jgi:hypothetical protein